MHGLLSGGPALIRPEEVLEGFWFIERGYLSGNHFATRTPAPVLIDTAYAGELSKTLATFEALGIDWRRAALVVSTHCHCDHVGANRAIQDASGCAVALHRVGKGFIDAGDRRATWWSYYDQEAELFEATRGLEDGEEIAVGLHRFQSLHCPGHSADGLVLYEPRARVLLSSDVLWERDLPVVTERVEGPGTLDALGASLERLASLEVARVFPGHGPAFEGFREAVARAQARVVEYAADRGRLAEELVKKLLVYTLLMRGPVPEGDLFPRLMATAWFPDTVEAYFGSAYEAAYRRALEALSSRGAVRVSEGWVATGVRP